jgi:RNA polymerase sigma-70 factor (ECF subfamily)
MRAIGKGQMATVGKGEARAFARDDWDLLYRRHCTGVISYVRRTFGSGPPDPEDVAHAVISRFATSGGAQGVDNAGAYLRRMARNFVLETHRRDQVSDRNLGQLKILNGESADFTPEDIIASKQELNRLDAALAQLKPKQRVALLLHRIDGLSFAAIARELDMSPSGARQLVETAHKACMAAMRRGER